MRRIFREWLKLADQLLMAGNGIAGEPGWPGSAPTQAQVQAKAAEIKDLRMQIADAELLLRGLRPALEKAIGEGIELMKLVDDTTSGLYGEAGGDKLKFGLPPKDRARRSLGPTPQVTKLVLADGLSSGSIQAKWKVVPRATFEVQWFSDASLTAFMGSLVTTRATALIPSLPPGAQIWVRVRALRGKKQGDWSDAATRIANV